MLLVAVALYLVFALAMGLSHRGLQYDEAMMVLGSVQMRNSADILPLPQDPHTWHCLAGRCFPLMTVRYVGALKEYLTLPAMAMFGSTAAVVRVVSILWSSLCIFGVGRLFGAGAAMLLALSPSLAGHTAFDNGAVAGWMGALGLVCLALARYRAGATLANAFWTGAAVGLGIWARANFLWLVAAAVVGWSPSILRWVRAQPRHAVAAGLGAMIGSLPFTAYQLVSGFGTFQAVGMFTAPGTVSELLVDRFGMWTHSLLSGVEHRSMWDGPAVPSWQYLPLAGAVAASLVVCLASRSRRGLGVTLGIFYGFLFLSRLPVAEHHFVPTLPIAAAVVATAASLVPRAGIAAAIVYAALCVHWQYKAVASLRSGGGTGQWSDAIVQVSEHLQATRGDRQVRILDWGLQNNLFVLSDTRIKSREDLGTSWGNAIAEGGLFLTNSGHGTFFPEPYGTFHRDLALSGREVEPTPFRERSGRLFAELWEIPPGAALPPPRWLSRVNAADPGHARQFYGVHLPEQNAWRWTKGRFSVILANPGGRAQLLVDLEIHVPTKVAPVTLNLFAGAQRLDAETYTTSGDHHLVRAIQSADNPVVVHISLDRSLPPSSADSRELGIIIKSAGIKSAELRRQ